MPSAVERVLTLPELLEKILLEVEKRTLIQAASVSRNFHKVIKTSKKIKERLWLKPYEILLAYLFNGFLVPEVYLNELFIDVLDDNPIRPTQLLTQQAFVYSQYSKQLGFKPMAQNASCRDMLLLQPPMKSVEVHVGYEPRPETPRTQRRGLRNLAWWYTLEEKVYNDQGVRVGQLLDIIESVGLVGKAKVFCELIVNFVGDEDDEKEEENMGQCDMRYPEEELVPNKQLVKVSIDDKKLSRVHVRLHVLQTEGLTRGMMKTSVPGYMLQKR